MTRPLFLIAALPQFFGLVGHAYLGERDIFPKVTVAKTGLKPASLRVLRLTWHMIAVTFGFMGSVLAVLGFKEGVLTVAERRVAAGISVWYAITGTASVLYWDRKTPQAWVFLVTAGIIQLGLYLTP